VLPARSTLVYRRVWAAAGAIGVCCWRFIKDRLCVVLVDSIDASPLALPSRKERGRHRIRKAQTDQEMWLQRICNEAAPIAAVPAPHVFIGYEPGAPWLARFYRDGWSIEFNGAYPPHDEYEVRWIMLHELTHAWVSFNGLDESQSDPHGPIFQDRARELGVS